MDAVLRVTHSPGIEPQHLNLLGGGWEGGCSWGVETQASAPSVANPADVENSNCLCLQCVYVKLLIFLS